VAHVQDIERRTEGPAQVEAKASSWQSAAAKLSGRHQGQSASPVRIEDLHTHEEIDLEEGREKLRDSRSARKLRERWANVVVCVAVVLLILFVLTAFGVISPVAGLASALISILGGVMPQWGHG
jgi:hypothetical protein